MSSNFFNYCDDNRTVLVRKMRTILDILKGTASAEDARSRIEAYIAIECALEHDLKGWTENEN